jgi:arginyl-tRNA synthetase
MEDGLDKESAEKAAPSTRAATELLAKWEAGDPEVRGLWERMNSWVYQAYEKTFERLGIRFEKFYYESDLYQLGKQSVMRGLEQGAFYRKDDSSVWVDLTGDGLDQKLLLRSNGTSVYITQDMATAEVRYQDYGMDRSVYVVGNEQEYHFKVLFLILKKLGKPFADGLYHLSYGMVDLPSGKMKSREGTTVDADDLIDEMEQTARTATQELGKTEGMSETELQQLYHTLGLGALKYFLLKVDPQKRMLFDPNESVDIHGHTGPFIQYAYTRTAAIRRKGEEVAAFGGETKPEAALHEHERLLLRRLYHYPQLLREAAEAYNPSMVSNYAYELARDYNRFYHGDKIVQSEQPQTSAFRFALSNFTGKTLEEAMKLLGIDMPERM